MANVLRATLILMSVCVVSSNAATQDGETLYNGIQLPQTWPPSDRAPSRDPMPVPYLDRPPEVIQIDVGRQLLIDDFLIEETTLKRTYHKAEYIEANPVLAPDKPWECDTESQGHPAPTAMPFSDGVWWDPADQIFKMWYMGGYVKSTCYATSPDGLHWEKPELDVFPGANILQEGWRDSSSVLLDLDDPDPARRYKLFVYTREGRLSIFFSPDGIHWGDRVATSGPLGDRSTVFYNPFRKVWVYNIRDYDGGGIGRFRRYSEDADVLKAGQWEAGETPFWIGADNLDPPREDLGTPCELYNLDAVAYESLLLGLFSIWRGQPKDRAKPNEICVGFSRDGFHWHRPAHEAFIPVSETFGDWNWCNVQSTGGCCCIVRDKLYFYVSGRAGVKGSASSGVCSTGLATLRRDGFASMDTESQGGTLTTHPVRFSGKYLFVNADTAKGELRVEVQDQDGQPIAPFTTERCKPLSKDSTLAQITWKGSNDLSALANRAVRFKFSLKNGSLYAFWVSPDASGASLGYVAAGGPGYTESRDTVGAKALEPEANKVIAVERTLYEQHTQKGISVWRGMQYVGPGLEREETRSFMAKSDTPEKPKRRRSVDNGRTWSEWEELPEVVSHEQGARIYWGQGPTLYDPASQETISIWLHQTHYDGLYHNQSFFRVSDDNGKTWSEPVQLRYEEGACLDKDNLVNPEFINKNQFYFGNNICRLSDGTLVHPGAAVNVPYENKTGKTYHPWFPADAKNIGSLCFAGKWDPTEKQYVWKAGKPVWVPFEISSRGLLEPEVAALTDGRVLVIWRGSDTPMTPGRKWFSVSNDGGMTLSPVQDLKYDDGTPFYSPSSIHRMIRSTVTNKLYWIGNISENPPSANSPRYPLIIAEVDETIPALKRDTITLIDDKGPEDSPKLQLSNFSVLEDRETHAIEIYLTRLGADPDDFWGSDAYKYTLHFK